MANETAFDHDESVEIEQLNETAAAVYTRPTDW
jgi:hypothetical protein